MGTPPDGDEDNTIDSGLTVEPAFDATRSVVVYRFPERTIEAPVVVAWRVRFGLRVQCPFCGRAHTHGPSEGTRISHCGRGAREYYLRPANATGPFRRWGER